MPLQITAHRHIEFLVGATEFHIGVHRHRVVPLEEGVQKLMQGNGSATAVAVRKIFFRQHLAHGAGAQQSDHRRKVHALQPLAVVANLKPSRGLEIEQRRGLGLVLPKLSQISRCIDGHIVFAQLNPRRALAGGITNPSREVANDQHRCVSSVLKGPQFAKQDAVPEVNVAARGIDAQLHPQRTPLSLSRRQPRRQGLIRIAGIPCREQVGHAAIQP